MGVDYFWKRVPTEPVGRNTARDLAGLAPY